MTTATATRSSHEVAVELAATVLAIQQCVGKDLAAQQPLVGAIEEQAKTAYRNRRADWLKLAKPVVRQALALRPVGTVPGENRRLAAWFVAELGDQLSADAAAALDAAMDLQISRGQHPDVAWQRAVAGYGLAGPAMQGYIKAATAVRPDGGMALLRISRQMAAKALLAQADRIGAREAAAWSTLPATKIAKAYDPREARDETGRWTRRAAKAKEQEPAVPDAVDAALTDAARRYADVPDDETAAANRYLTAANRYTANRYTAAPNRYVAAAENRYAAAAENRYAAAPTGENRYVNRYQPKAQPPSRVNRIVLFGSKKPSETPPEPTVVDADEFGLYLPMDKIRGYYHDENRPDPTTITGRRRGTVLNFAKIGDHLEQIRGDPEPIELSEQRTPWDMVEGIEEIDTRAWQELMPKAKILWDEVQADPMRAVSRLHTPDLQTIAERAGYPMLRTTDDISDEIETNYEMQQKNIYEMEDEDGVTRYRDDNLLDALADYVVWNNPRSWGHAEGLQVNGILKHSLGDPFDDVEPPEVISFGARLTPDEDGGRMHGQYYVDRVEYHSAIRHFDVSTPPGVFALREIHLRPDIE